MSDDKCRWNGRNRPRTLPGRHEPECTDERCDGCQACSERHCGVCRRVHADGACAECLAETRDALHQIGRLCDSLPEEVENRGIEGEAMMLLGPSADPEARGHLEASVLAGRVPADYLDQADGELHPLFVLGTWDMCWRDALEHDEPSERLTVAVAIDYLDRQLTYMASFEHVPFEDFARDLRACQAHLESVLHDGEQVDEGVPCLKCGLALRRAWGTNGKEDGWECRRCHQWSTEAQYRFAVKADYIANAEWLTDVDMVIRFPEQQMAPATIRSWASDKPGRPATIRKRRHSERTEFSVQDVEAQIERRGKVA